MKKMKTLFLRTFENHHVANTVNEVTDGCEWAINGEMCKIKRTDFNFEWNGKTSKH